ncbi:MULTISPECIES: glycoside hydrolase family 18 chitinase [unclassified Streptomyces]|uniref:glycoside hydrolase family 18 chitinase n=1 Tax=unclassified Streptomyces TaxID=2593676 RepID=UPI0022542C5F|nr:MULTISPECIES: glycoside hydrolase family 18 chitinase [unclassified Streptomyces]MCX4528139.1 glycoside hydrolase family 18 chitinase [Streptomyces sp. NBC_01551]MCX4541261.1 glycoside hydrolase family 18 chitinase [Streptomyces sp. NBC_01565]
MSRSSPRPRRTYGGAPLSTAPPQRVRLFRRVAATLAAFALPIAGLVALAGPAEAAASATATYTKVSDWGSGFEGKWTVKNTGTTTISSWTVEWDYPAGTTVTSAWDATVTSSGTHWTGKNVGWNGTLSPGASISFGFNGAGPGAPGGCKINGASCDGGSQPGDNPPSAPGTPTASNVTENALTLNWSAATDDKGVKNYDVYRGGTKLTTVTGTSYGDSGLTKGTAYTYTVTARDTVDQTGPSSGSLSVTTPGGTVPPDPGGKVKLGYFTNWGVYQRNYHVKNLVTSGSAGKITHINYAFGNVQNGKCTIGDSYADYDKAYTADQSVDGVADTWDQPLRGNFNQLRKLKKQYPNIKVLWSFGGWTWSGGFGQAAQNPTAFAQSCYDLVEDPRWADVFDGIDLDWEYPNACGLSCDTSGAASLKNMMQAMRAKFGAGNLVTAAISADGSNGGKLDAADYAGAAQYVDFYNVMTYDFFGAWAAQGPTAPHSPLTAYSGIPQDGFNSEAAITKLKGKGIAGSKLNLGIGFYGRGWTGVTQATPGGTATGPAPGTYEQGIEDYKVLKNSCPSTGTIAGTAYAKCGSNWWSYDTPATVAGKMAWTKQQGLRGAFFWEFSGDTANGELAGAIHTGLQ